MFRSSPPQLTVVNDFVMGKEVGDQQLGCLWQNEHLLSVGLNGFINYLDPARFFQSQCSQFKTVLVTLQSNQSMVIRRTLIV